MDPFDQERYGVALFDQLWYFVSVKLAARVTPTGRLSSRLKHESEELRALLSATDLNQASDRVKVARLVGMEPVSCDWSILMICEHLTLFVDDVTKVTDAMLNSKPLRGSFSDEQHLPSDDVGVDVVERFERAVDNLCRLVESNSQFQTRITFSHSWLGRMNASQWLCWTATHIGIHRRHAQKILSVSGVV